MAERGQSRLLRGLKIVIAIISFPAAAAWHAGGLAATSRTASLAMIASRRLTRTEQQQQALQEEEEEPPHKSILSDDGHGHINRDLAGSLWRWEQEHRKLSKLPQLSFSTSQGLKLVDDIVKDIATSPRGRKFIQADGSDDVRTDLVQEGVMALMDALLEYRQQQQNEVTTNDPNAQFEAYARPYLENRLWATLDRTARPVQLPETESYVWKHVQQIRPQLQSELGGRMPTTKELAARLELPTETLELLFSARRDSLSMESTVEIVNPDSLENNNAHFIQQNEWEAREGQLLSDGQLNDEQIFVEEYQDAMYQYEGTDEMWIHEAQVAAPLRDVIPDDQTRPDDLALNDMIRHDVGEFLTKTLKPEEVQVVRLSFGLDNDGDGAGKNQGVWEEIGEAMDLTPSQVKELLTGALEKLRTNYQKNYVETSNLDEEQDFFGEDSV